MSAAFPAGCKQTEGGVIAQDWNVRKLALLAQLGSDPNSGHCLRAGHWWVTDLAKPQVQGSDPDWAGCDDATQIIAASADSTRTSGGFAIKNRPKTASFRQKRSLIPEYATKKVATTERRTPATGRLDTKIASQRPFCQALAVLDVKDAA